MLTYNQDTGAPWGPGALRPEFENRSIRAEAGLLLGWQTRAQEGKLRRRRPGVCRVTQLINGRLS